MLATGENIFAEIQPIIQQAIIDASNYVDTLESSELSRDDANRSKSKQTANEMLDKGA